MFIKLVIQHKTQNKLTVILPYPTHQCKKNQKHIHFTKEQSIKITTKHQTVGTTVFLLTCKLYNTILVYNLNDLNTGNNFLTMF